MKDVESIQIINKLKSVYRKISVEDRKESSAEHTWSSMMLADYFLSKKDYKIDKFRVFELILYHDLVEIETGDIPLDPSGNSVKDVEEELKAARKLKEQLNATIGDKFIKCFTEFVERKTPEARFAKAIDVLDAVIAEIDYKKDWKGWNKEFLVSNKSQYLKEFPELKECFDNIVDHIEKEGYFDQ